MFDKIKERKTKCKRLHLFFIFALEKGIQNNQWQKSRQQYKILQKH